MTKKRNKLNNILIWLGLIIVFGTHIYMLALGLPPEQMNGHAIINLIAGVLLAIGIWKK